MSAWRAEKSMVPWLVIVLAPAIALAAPTTEERALATQLFKDGKALMMTGNYAEACPKLAESQRLDPGGGTLLNLALCREGEGKTALALVLFREALAIAKQDGRADRAKLAQEHIDALDPKVARVRISVLTQGPHVVAITLDGKPLDDASRGVAIAVDPGEHRVEASALGRIPFAITVVAIAGSTRDVEVPILAAEAVSTPPPVVAPPPPPPPVAAKPIEPKPIDVVDRPSRTPAYVAFTVTGIALVSGGVFAWQALAQRHKSDGECTPGCTEAGVTYNERAKSWADATTISLGIGAAAAIAGVFLWTSSSPSRPAVTIVPQPLGLAVHAVF